MSWERIAERLEQGHDVVLHPKGNSMTPLIKSGQRVKISSLETICKHRDVRVGDVVLAYMGGRKWYVHLVTAIDGDRYQISNNHGHVNGWTRSLWGVVTEIGG